MSRRPGTRHGLNALMTRVKVRGLAAIDKRTGAAQDLLRWRQELLDALGGEDHASPQQRQLVDLAARVRLFLDHVDAFLMEQESLLVGRGKKKALLPVLKERMTLSRHLAELMSQLGLQRQQKPVGSVWDWKREGEREGARDGAEGESAPARDGGDGR